MTPIERITKLVHHGEVLLNFIEEVHPHGQLQGCQLCVAVRDMGKALREERKWLKKHGKMAKKEHHRRATDVAEKA